MRMLPTLLLSIICLAATGCDQKLSTLAGPTPSLEPTFASVQSQIFETTDVAGRQACVNCHTIGGTNGKGTFGPDLTHLMSREMIAAGAAENTRESLRLWVKNPDDIKPGARMPAMQLNDQQLDDVVAYLLSLH